MDCFLNLISNQVRVVIPLVRATSKPSIWSLFRGWNKGGGDIDFISGILRRMTESAMEECLQIDYEERSMDTTSPRVHAFNFWIRVSPDQAEEVRESRWCARPGTLLSAEGMNQTSMRKRNIWSKTFDTPTPLPARGKWDRQRGLSSYYHYEKHWIWWKEYLNLRSSSCQRHLSSRIQECEQHCHARMSIPRQDEWRLEPYLIYDRLRLLQPAHVLILSLPCLRFVFQKGGGSRNKANKAVNLWEKKSFVS